MNTLHRLLFLFAVLFCTDAAAQAPLFPNSVVSNDIDFIQSTDTDAFSSLSLIGRARKEMPSSLSDDLFDPNTYVFEALFNDGERLELWCHSSFGTLANAREYAEKVSPRLGKLPAFQRNSLDHVVIHTGNAGAFAEIQGQFFVLYADNMDARISTNDLEETVFHESVHASYQFMYQNDAVWTDAQAADLSFVTTYGRENPTLEDMAESALFAYTLLAHPGRLPAEIEEWLQTNNPNRIEFFRAIYSIPNSTDDFVARPPVITYPNPNNGLFSVSLPTVSDGAHITVFDQAGKQVASVVAQRGNNELDLTKLANGIYFLTVPGYRRSRLVKQ